MRISDWSSDVCSSDLPGCPHRRLRRLLARELPHGLTLGVSTLRPWASANFVGARHLFPCSVAAGDDQGLARTLHAHLGAVEFRLPGHIVADVAVEREAPEERSEEHTSELQSLMRISYAVFCLKKKTKQ